MSSSEHTAKKDDTDWEETLNEVPDLVNTMSLIVGNLQAESDDDDLIDEWDSIKSLAVEALEDLQNAESSEKAEDLWSNLKNAQKKADKLKDSLQKIRPKARQDKAVLEAIAEATQALRPLLRDLDGLIP
jgi:ABC-type Zn uptake system ZnuABC Zn-binding protein ZnuA